MLSDEHARSKAYMACLGVLEEIANLTLHFTGFRDTNTLWRMYFKVENNKYPTNKVLRS